MSESRDLFLYLATMFFDCDKLILSLKKTFRTKIQESKQNCDVRGNWLFEEILVRNGSLDSNRDYEICCVKNLLYWLDSMIF
jgi:hypothetical protein